MSSDQDRRDRPSERSRIDTAINLVQPLATIIGGCWIAFLYFSFQQKSDDTDLRTKQLAIEQAKIVLQTQEQSNRLDVDLKKVSLDQARVALEIQQSEKEMRNTQLSTEVELKKQEVILNRLKEKQQEHDVEYSTNYRSSYEMNVISKKVGELSKDLNRYKVSVHFALKNESTVSYEVSYMAVEYYAGVLKEDTAQSRENVRLAALGTPPSLVNSEAETGAFEWTRLGVPSSSVWGPTVGDLGTWQYLLDSTVRTNGPNTGIVLPGGKTQFDYDYVVTAKPGTHLGFVVDWIINRGKGRDDVNYLNRVIDLPTDNTTLQVDR